jgi:hypothetical protein
MANAHLSSVLAEFEATVHRTKNRLIAIPADIQRKLRMQRRPNNHIVFYSIRPKGAGRWNHRLAFLTYDNEFSVPDLRHIEPGSEVEIRIRRLIPDQDALTLGSTPPNAGALFSTLAEHAGVDDRSDGSQNVDGYLYGEQSNPNSNE